MSTNQDLRYAENGGANNPYGVYSQYKVDRFIAPNNGVPSPSLGTMYDEYIDLDTGIEYIKNESGIWDPVINWSTGIPHEDPFVVSSIHTDEIQGNTGDDIQINLQTAGNLYVGPS